jgi:hypothetical protein
MSEKLSDDELEAMTHCASNECDECDVEKICGTGTVLESMARELLAYREAKPIDDPKPQADDVETIRTYIDKWKRKSLTHKQAREEALAALSRLFAPIDVQAKADAVVDEFADNYAPLNELNKAELSRIIVEQFSSKG